jgi:predicted ATPase
MNLPYVTRCEYCARLIYKNVSGKYKLCSLKCKNYFKKNKSNNELEKLILQIISKGWNEISVIFSTFNNIDKFEFISAIGRMVHFDNRLKTKSKNEISMRSCVSKVKK